MEIFGEPLGIILYWKHPFFISILHMILCYDFWNTLYFSNSYIVLDPIPIWNLFVVEFWTKSFLHESLSIVSSINKPNLYI